MKNKHAQLKLFTLFSLLLLFCTFESMAQEKLITINVKNVSLKEIFNIIENQTPYRFSYRSVVLDADRNISISAENISVTTVLNQALKDRNLEYSIVSPKTIVRHFPYLATSLSCIALNFSTRELSGTIHNREVLLSRRQ